MKRFLTIGINTTIRVSFLNNRNDSIYMPEKPQPESYVEPSPEEKFPKPSSEIPPELQEYIPEAQRFIDNYRELFFAIARDRSLDFKPGPAFFIDLKSGVINLDVKDWKLAKERGLSEWQILWSVCHEISHFYDLRESPEQMLGNFEYLERRAKELEPQVLEILRQKLDGELPEHLTREIPLGKKGERTMTPIQKFLYDKLHLLYNSLDDMYVNGTLAQRSGAFDERTGSQAPEVKRLYRDILFPTKPKEPGAPPEELEAADYANLPKSYQLAYALLRRRMVGDQEILVSPEVQTKLKGYTDKVAEKHGLTLEKEVTNITRPLPRPAFGKKSGPWDPGWRYERIKQAVEPHFIELLMKDLEEMPPPPPPEQASGASGSAENPWQELDEKSEPIDIDTIKDFIKQQKEKKKEEDAKKKEAERKARLTPEQKTDEAQRKEDAEICKKYDIDPAAAEEYRDIERSIEPYKRELANVFEEVMNSVSARITRFWAEGFRSGKFNVERFIRKYGTELSIGRPEIIPWDTLDVYDQREFISRLMLFPERIRMRLVLDGSGSMTEERILALKQLSVLILEALSTFEATINLRFRLKDPVRVDTEIHMFGDQGKSKIVKSFAASKPTEEDERADRFRAFGKINNGYGVTYDAEPFEKIANSIDATEEADLKAGKAKEFAFEITDGGSQSEQETRNAIDVLEQKGAVKGQPTRVIVRGFQIGEPQDSEKAIFDRIWGEAGARIAHPKDLAPAIAELLANEFRKTEMLIQYYGEEEE